MAEKLNFPDTPAIIVQPSKTAKSGKFDCAVMSLSLLLDYRQEDNKEHSFEVCVSISEMKWINSVLFYWSLLRVDI